jgi:hypothetical protein
MRNDPQVKQNPTITREDLAPLLPCISEAAAPRIAELAKDIMIDGLTTIVRKGKTVTMLDQEYEEMIGPIINKPPESIFIELCLLEVALNNTVDILHHVSSELGEGNGTPGLHIALLQGAVSLIGGTLDDLVKIRMNILHPECSGGAV